MPDETEKISTQGNLGLFLNCSRTNDGSIIGIWPPRLSGVTGLHPFVICSISAV